MRKLFAVMIFFSTICFANELEITTQIIDKISHALIQKNVIKVEAVGDKEKQIIAQSTSMKNVNDCNEADMVLTQTTLTCKDKIVFFTRYKTFKKNPQAIGAMFWQKGRPNIIFRKKVLQRYHIALPQEFNKYIE